MCISLLCESCKILEHGDFQRLNCNASFLMVHFFEVSSLLFYLPSSVEMTFPQCSPQTHSQSVLLYVLYFYNPSPFDFFFHTQLLKMFPLSSFHMCLWFSIPFSMNCFLSFPLFFLSIFSTFSFFSLSLSFLFSSFSCGVVGKCCISRQVDSGTVLSSFLPLLNHMLLLFDLPQFLL